VFKEDGLTFLVDKKFLEEAKPIKVDFGMMGFRIESSLNLGGGKDACSSCGSGSCG